MGEDLDDVRHAAALAGSLVQAIDLYIKSRPQALLNSEEVVVAIKEAVDVVLGTSPYCEQKVMTPERCPWDWRHQPPCS